MKTDILKMKSEMLIIEKCIIWGSDQEDMIEIALPSLVLLQDPLLLPGLEFEGWFLKPLWVGFWFLFASHPSCYNSRNNSETYLIFNAAIFSNHLTLTFYFKFTLSLSQKINFQLFLKSQVCSTHSHSYPQSLILSPFSVFLGPCLILDLCNPLSLHPWLLLGP